MKTRFSLIRFLQSDEATTSVEYAIMLALIIMVALVGVGVFGGSAGNLFTRIEAEFPT